MGKSSPRNLHVTNLHPPGGRGLDLVACLSWLASTVWSGVHSVPAWAWTLVEGGGAGTAASIAYNEYQKREARRMKHLEGCKADLRDILTRPASLPRRVDYGGVPPPSNPGAEVQLWPPSIYGPGAPPSEVRVDLRRRALSHLSDPHYQNAASALLRAEAKLHADDLELFHIWKEFWETVANTLPGPEWPVPAEGQSPNYNPRMVNALLIKALTGEPENGKTRIELPNQSHSNSLLWMGEGTGSSVATWDEPHIRALEASVNRCLLDPTLIRIAKRYRRVQGNGGNDPDWNHFEAMRKLATVELARTATVIPIYGTCKSCRPEPCVLSRIVGRLRKGAQQRAGPSTGRP